MELEMDKMSQLNYYKGQCIWKKAFQDAELASVREDWTEEALENHGLEMECIKLISENDDVWVLHYYSSCVNNIEIINKKKVDGRYEYNQVIEL